MFSHRHGYHPLCKPPGPGLGQYVSKGSPCFLFSSLSVCVQQSSWSDTDWILATHQIVRLLKTPKSKSLNLYIDSQTPSLFFCFLLPLFSPALIQFSSYCLLTVPQTGWPYSYPRTFAQGIPSACNALAKVSACFAF